MEHNLNKESVTESLNTSLDQGLEDAILKFAIQRFPYRDALGTLPGHDENKVHRVLKNMIRRECVKVGFHYEKMQDRLTLFYFLKIRQDKHIVLGLDPRQVQVSINSEVTGVFRIDDEQYLSIMQIPLC